MEVLPPPSTDFTITSKRAACRPSGCRRSSWAGVQLGTRRIDTRSIHVTAPPSAAFAPIRRIGGELGWYHVDWLWCVQGFLDLLVGGFGLR